MDGKQSVYQSEEKKLTIIQQRTAVLPVRVHAVRPPITLPSLQPNASLAFPSRPIRTIYSADVTQVDATLLSRFAGLTTSSEVASAGSSAAQEAAEATSNDQWVPIRGAGMAPLLHAACDEQKLPFVAWVMPCAEGDNVPDAVAMATQLLKALRLAPKPSSAADPVSTHPSMAPMLPLAFPPSWSQLFGRGPDVAAIFRLELAKALEQVTAQRTKLLSKSASQPLAPLVPLDRPSGCDSFSDLLLCGCGEELRPADERTHSQFDCSLRLIRCIRPGCSQLFPAWTRELHEQRDCRFVRHSKQLLRDREDGDTPVECELCHETRFVIRKRHLARHQLYMCVKRPVACRFAPWGCDQQVPLDEQQAHEANDCVVAERRRKIAADALLVNEEVVCEWCQQTVKKRKLLDHQEDHCPERERPCPNSINGCKEWVPVGKVGEHLRSECSVTQERDALAARAREKNAVVTCPECGLAVRLRYLPRHYRDECVSRVVACKNAAHGCRARLRWRDRHLHEDFMTLTRDRSMLQFQTGGDAFISVNCPSLQASQATSGGGQDLSPPWSAEYFLWMVDADEEILSLLKSSVVLMETVAVATHENTQWQAKADACKQKLKELKQKRKHKASGKSQAAAISGEELSASAKELAEDFNAAEQGLLATRKTLALAKGWVQLNVTEAKRIFDLEVREEGDKQAVRVAISDQTAQILQEKPRLVQLLAGPELTPLSDLEAWAQHVASGSQSNDGKEEQQRKAAEQSKLLKKRSEWQTLLTALDPEDPDSQRLQRRYERELEKADAKLALVSENKPTQLLERCGRHIIASSARNVISLVAGAKGEIAFYRPSGAKAARDVNFQTRLERNRWSHVVFSAGAKELSLFVNGELKTIRRGVFDLPMGHIGTKEKTESFQGFVQEIRYWKECRSRQQIQQYASSILSVAKCKNLVGYWTFEEGMGDLVDDMALKRPRSACFNTQWVLYDSPAVRKRFGIPPTPSLRDQTSCIINQRLKLLAQRARDRDLDVVPCRQLCEQLVAFRQLERHHRIECVNRVVVCREFGCGQLYRFAEETQHLRTTCEPHKYRDELVRRYTEKQELTDCILNCGQQIQKRFLTHHCHHDCVNRLIVCPWADCQETVVAHALEMHLARECQSQTRETQRQLVANARRRQAAKDSAAAGEADEKAMEQDRED
ncbi:hypothetical protein BBJ28_00013126 [Nothophytophthora sp. Chile5]|nr:hypothetical protein BBJ28_00013126 [Nothophytophthora sp. Chile5]